MEVYRIAPRAMERDFGPEDVAALAVQLPEGCRWRVAFDPDAWWTGERILVAGLLNNLRQLMWGMSDSKRRGAPPKPLGPSWATKGAMRSLAMTPMGKEELLSALARPRKEESDG